MRRSDFLRSFVRGGVVVSTGLALNGQIRILSKWSKSADARYEDGRLIEEPGRVLSGEIQFYAHSYKNLTESEFKKLWEDEMDMLKESAWTAVNEERSRLLAGIRDDKA
jgi:hypothetical protein